ncbi:hypothetical protein ACH4CE_24780 [Streptomyces gelaticus]|uniref:hypothetical protein n=1 Tax=Streptomyces gelaticus TaxID=285446 RepID=UPI0037BC646B
MRPTLLARMSDATAALTSGTRTLRCPTPGCTVHIRHRALTPSDAHDLIHLATNHTLHSPEPKRRAVRLRIQRSTWPRPTLVLTDTPRPNCPACGGEGGHHHDYGDHEGEYAGTEWEPCTCWDENCAWTLVRLPHRPRWLRRSRPAVDPWASSEPPF